MLKNYANMGDMEAVKRYLDELAEDLNTVDLVLDEPTAALDPLLEYEVYFPPE